MTSVCMHIYTMQRFAFLTLEGMMKWVVNLGIAVYSLVSHLLCDLQLIVRSVYASVFLVSDMHYKT